MIVYLISFFIVIVIGTLTFRSVLIILENVPNGWGDNLLFLLTTLLIIIILIMTIKPDFFKLHTNGNGIFKAEEYVDFEF